MAKHPTSSRVHRGDEAPDDAFVAAIKGSYTWAQENTRTVAIGLAIVLALGIGAIVWVSQQRQVEQQAAERLNQVQQTLASGNVQLAVRDLQAYLERFGGTDAAKQARILLAGILLEQDQPQEAVDALGNLHRDIDDPMGIAAAKIQAAALEQAGNHEGAARVYLRIADDARFTFERREALADAARVHLHNGQPERAAELYDRVIGTFAADEQGRGYFEMWRAEAQARAGAAAATPAEDGEAGTDTDAG